MNKSRIQAAAEFKKLFERLSYSQDYATTFTSFLDYALWRLAPYCGEQMKEELQRLDKMYKPEMAPVMNDMFDAWSICCDDDGAGFYDALGDLFMECVSFGRNGQFFTPQPICDMMAQVLYGDDLKEDKTVCDPACGSGRTLLAMAKMQRRMKFYASDNDHTCVKMCVLNFIVNSMKGEVAWMNTLSMEHYKSYHINTILVSNHYIPVLTITGKDETYFKQRLQSSLNNAGNTEKIKEEFKEPAKEEVTKPVKKQTFQSQLLFDF